MAFGASLLQGNNIPTTVDPQDLRAYYCDSLKAALATLLIVTPSVQPPLSAPVHLHSSPSIHLPPIASVLELAPSESAKLPLSPPAELSPITSMQSPFSASSSKILDTTSTSVYHSAKKLQEDYASKIEDVEMAIHIATELSATAKAAWIRQIEAVTTQVNQETALPTSIYVESMTISISKLAATTKEQNMAEDRLYDILGRCKNAKVHYDTIVNSLGMIAAQAAEEEEDNVWLQTFMSAQGNPEHKN